LTQRRAILLSLATAAVGCLAPPERGLPLYAAGAAAVPSGQVATLDVQVPFPSAPGAVRTFIQSVDGRDVATLASPFELLPGCHVVETAPHWAGIKARLIYFPTSPGRTSSRSACTLLHAGNAAAGSHPVFP
jgi:hypothetical protein